jgi:hypothetical protein
MAKGIQRKPVLDKDGYIMEQAVAAALLFPVRSSGLASVS